LNRKASDYDLLRQRHPKTIFVVIFQKTTGNTMRGGSAITFDSSAIINVTAITDENNIVRERLAKKADTEQLVGFIQLRMKKL
jgi:hypothetical protein